MSIAIQACVGMDASKAPVILCLTHLGGWENARRQLRPEVAGFEEFLWIGSLIRESAVSESNSFEKTKTQLI